MTDLYPTKARRALLAAIGGGHVRISHGGATIHHVRGGTNQRCDAKARELVAAGWVVLGRDGGTYELTAAGQDVLDGVR